MHIKAKNFPYSDEENEMGFVAAPPTASNNQIANDKWDHKCQYVDNFSPRRLAAVAIGFSLQSVKQNSAHNFYIRNSTFGIHVDLCLIG